MVVGLLTPQQQTQVLQFQTLHHNHKPNLCRPTYTTATIEEQFYVTFLHHNHSIVVPLLTAQPHTQVLQFHYLQHSHTHKYCSSTTYTIATHTSIVVPLLTPQPHTQVLQFHTIHHRHKAQSLQTKLHHSCHYRGIFYITFLQHSHTAKYCCSNTYTIVITPFITDPLLTRQPQTTLWQS